MLVLGLTSAANAAMDLQICVNGDIDPIDSEIWLDRKLVDKRIWPAIDINRSGTRKEEILMDPEEHRRVCVLRRVLNDMNPPEAMELLVSRLVKTQSNAEFLMSMNMK